MLRVRLFGTFAMEADGVALPMPERRRACSLLGWIALHPGMHPRSEVAARFWPDVLDSSARKSLRTELVAVRRAIGAENGGVLVATREMVGLVGDGLVVDAREFERLVRARPLGRGRRPGRRRVAPGARRGVGLRGPRGAPPRARRGAGSLGGGRRGGGRADGGDSHRASARRAGPARRGRAPPAHPVPDRRGGGLGCPPGVRRPRTPPASRAGSGTVEGDAPPTRGGDHVPHPSQQRNGHRCRRR